jgi:hypothetical protein
MLDKKSNKELGQRWLVLGANGFIGTNLWR